MTGGKVYPFGKTRKIPLLSDVIDAVKNEELVMYLNVSLFYSMTCFRFQWITCSVFSFSRYDHWFLLYS